MYKNQQKKKEKAEAFISRQAPGMCFDFHSKVNLYYTIGGSLLKAKAHYLESLAIKHLLISRPSSLGFSSTKCQKLCHGDADFFNIIARNPESCLRNRNNNPSWLHIALSEQISSDCF